MRREDNSAPVIEGDVLAGKYKVERVLGAGGMGVVVAARHLQLDQLVALKFVLPSSIDQASVTERFLREAKAAVRLKSEHVAKVLDVGTLESGAPYMVMEYLDGQNLADVVGQFPGGLALETACDYIIQACEALSEAHSISIVHRDVKPQNLFLTKGVGGAALVKVLDFGISKIKQPEGAKNLTQTSTVMGSPLYMAPEQLRSARSVDHRTDIWALGVVLYELLSGKLPFEAETMTELTIRIVQDPVAPLELTRPDLPPDLVAVVYKCLEKAPASRFQDTGELASALEPFAPVASRVVVDRTRKVVSALHKTMGAGPAGSLPVPAGSGPVRAVSSPTHLSAGTPPPWTETTHDKKKNVVPLLLGGGAMAVALIVAGLFGLRAVGRGSGAAPVAGDPGASVGLVPSAAVTMTQPAVAPVPVASAVPVAAPVAPIASAAPAAPSAAPAPAAANADPLAVPPRTGPAPRGGAIPRTPSPKPAAPASAAPAKPAPPGDDIPSLR